MKEKHGNDYANLSSPPNLTNIVFDAIQVDAQLVRIDLIYLTSTQKISYSSQYSKDYHLPHCHFQLHQPAQIPYLVCLNF